MQCLYRFRTERFYASEPSLNVVLSDYPVEHEVGDLPGCSLWHLRERRMEHSDIYAGPAFGTGERERRAAKINLVARHVERVGYRLAGSACWLDRTAGPGWRLAPPATACSADGLNDRDAVRADSEAVLGLDSGPGKCHVRSGWIA